MNSKERIDAVLHHQPVDRTPFCLVDGGAWITRQEGVSYRQFYDRVDAGASEITLSSVCCFRPVRSKN